ncbi:hypothetical protein [Streptacidiphilus sp. EB103A]|uniref:hypothetical protein n=1 Tax=Streptacidiphilus sp. EB103A TaxID=3156275 RepID=UPI0035116F83
MTVTDPPSSVDMANQPERTADGMSLVFWPNIAVGLTYASCRPQVIFQPDQAAPGPMGPYSVNDTTKTGDTCDMTFDVDPSLPWRAYTRDITTGAWTLVLGNGSQAAGERLTVTVQDGISEAALLIQARGYPLGQPVGQAGDHGAIVNRLPASVNSFFTR